MIVSGWEPISKLLLLGWFVLKLGDTKTMLSNQLLHDMQIFPDDGDISKNGMKFTISGAG